MNKQTTSAILMIRPEAFRYNEQTAENNLYQRELKDLSAEEIQLRAQNEFDQFVNTLTEAGLRIIVISDTAEPDTPDAVFPNNWISFHEDGSVVLYPMFAPNRRQERRLDLIRSLQEEHEFRVEHIYNLSYFEEDKLFLEGTGSMVLDRRNKIAYACLSPRTSKKVLQEFCRKLDYKPFVFTATQMKDATLTPIYHTNVMMSVGEELAVVCLETIRSEQERAKLVNSLENSGKKVIDISEEQKNAFLGNMLQTETEEGERLMVMSQQAYQALNDEQLAIIELTNKIIYSPLDTIETCGGGSARCMMAEIFLPKR